MFIKKKTFPKLNRRTKERRKPGDRRFPGRLVGKIKVASRHGERRKVHRRMTDRRNK